MPNTKKNTTESSKQPPLTDSNDDEEEEGIEVGSCTTTVRSNTKTTWARVVVAGGGVDTDIEHHGSLKEDEEGIESPHHASSAQQDENKNTSGAVDPSSFSVFPALERSESFMRRRVEKRKGQEAIVQTTNQIENAKYSSSLSSFSPQKKETSTPIDLDELEEEEEARIRRYSNHGSYGILESSRGCDEAGGSGNGRFRSYRRDQLISEIDSANQRGEKGHADVLRTLRTARILVYIIDARVCVTLKDVVDGIHEVVDHIRKNSEHRDHPNNQKCLLYRDFDGRLFNLVLASEYSNLDGKWRGNLDSFSVVQAAALVTFLARSLSCAFELETMDNFRQVSLVVILGVVFIEEISLSWTNVAMLVRGFPSMSAYTLSSSIAGTDWLRKLLILVFVASSASTDATFQKVCTLGGILLTCVILLANLGSLSWKYLHWKPFRGLFLYGNSGTILDPFIAFVAAVLAGICFPFMGHSKVEAGGTAAIESVMQMAIVVAALFVLSDWDPFQRLLVSGSETCNQNYVNFIVGSWWALSLIASLTLLFSRDIRKSNRKGKEFNPYKRDFTFPNDEEPLLEEEPQSPAGYKVPHLPFFPVNPSYTHKGLGSRCCVFRLGVEYSLGLLVAVTIGGFICYLGVTKLDDDFLENPVSAFSTIRENITR